MKQRDVMEQLVQVFRKYPKIAAFFGVLCLIALLLAFQHPTELTNFVKSIKDQPTSQTQDGQRNNQQQGSGNVQQNGNVGPTRSDHNQTVTGDHNKAVQVNH